MTQIFFTFDRHPTGGQHLIYAETVVLVWAIIYANLVKYGLMRRGDYYPILQILTLYSEMLSLTLCC